jgi:hypothetical protein
MFHVFYNFILCVSSFGCILTVLFHLEYSYFSLPYFLMSYCHHFLQMKHPCSTPFGYSSTKCNFSYNLPLDVVSFIERTYNLEEQKKVSSQFSFLEFFYFILWSDFCSMFLVQSIMVPYNFWSLFLNRSRIN